jgi:hypothetical protein
MALALACIWSLVDERDAAAGLRALPTPHDDLRAVLVVVGDDLL